MFRQTILTTNIAYYITVLSIGLGAWLIYTGTASPYWLLAVPFMHLFNSVIASAGVHRYAAHAAYKTNWFWHKVIMYYGGVLMLQGPILTTAVLHRAHHKYVGGPHDPHVFRWSLLFFKRYNPNTILSLRFTKKLLRVPDVRFTYKYGILIWALFTVIVCAISWEAYLFAYLIPLGTSNIVVALHFIHSHKNVEPVNAPWMEWLLPAGGEWIHKIHHEKPLQLDYRDKWYHLDLGWLFIKAIKK